MLKRHLTMVILTDIISLTNSQFGRLSSGNSTAIFAAFLAVISRHSDLNLNIGIPAIPNRLSSGNLTTCSPDTEKERRLERAAAMDCGQGFGVRGMGHGPIGTN